MKFKLIEEKINSFDLDEALGLKENKETKTCVICKKEYTGYGNNAEPVAKGQCCDDCNRKVVIPARLKKNTIVEKSTLKEDRAKVYFTITLKDSEGNEYEEQETLPEDLYLEIRRNDNWPTLISYFQEYYDDEVIGVEQVGYLKEDTIKQNGKWVNKGKEGTHGTFKTKKAADQQRKAMFAQGYSEDVSEALHNDEISDFFDKAKRLGVKTLGDLRKLLNEDPASIGNTEKEKIDAYADAVELGDCTLSNESLKKDLDKESLEQEIRKVIRQYFKRYGDDDYEEIVNDYLNIDIEDKDDKTKVEVRAELSYDSMDKIADLLNPIVQKLDKDAYFDHEDIGIINAFIKNNNKHLHEELTETEELKSIEIPGYQDTWSEIDRAIVDFGSHKSDYRLMENDEYGDETCYLLITPDFKNIYETFDNIEDCLKDEFPGEELSIEYPDELDEKLIQGKSDATLKKNIATEVKAGKDPKQAYAIAKSIQKKNESLYNDPEEAEIDSLYHDVSEDELRKMGAFDNLNDDEPYVEYESSVISDDIDAFEELKTATPERAAEINNEIHDLELDIDRNDDTNPQAVIDDQVRLAALQESDEDEIVDYVNPNISDKPTEPKNVDLNKI